MTEPRTFDVVVVGSSLAGVVAGAVLAKRGYSVAVVDALEQAGGRVGAVQHEGYWINWGHRDAVSGIGDVNVPENAMDRAMVEADVKIPRRSDGFGVAMRIHALPEGLVIDVPNAAISGGVVDEMAMYRGLVGMFCDITDEKQAGEVAVQVKETLAQLGSIDDATAWSLVPVTLGEWCQRHHYGADLRTVLVNYLEATASSPGEDASIGRFIFHLRNDLKVAGTLEDDEVGGMQTAIQPFVRGIQANGGELWFGWKPIEITVENQRITGVVAVNTANLVQEFRTKVVVTDWFGWDLPKLIDERLLPKTFLEKARSVEPYGTDVASWVAGCSRMPTVRTTGEAEDFPGWQRISLGDGVKKSYFGGFHWPSFYHHMTAPEGKHLIMVTVPHTGNERYMHWKDAKAAVDVALEYVRSYYEDLDDCVDWSSYQWVSAPQVLTWYLKPVYRHPIKVATIHGLYVAASSVEGTGAWVDIEVAAALDACDLVEAEWGEVLRAAS
jgi:hypothetical protein